MSSPTLWSAGRYEVVARHLSHIADEVVDAVERRRPLHEATLVDLACGTGSAALAAAGRGARVTGLDITPELIAIATAHDGDGAVTWRTGDAADTGLPGAAFDVAVSNMGIIFVDPQRQVAEINRLLKPAGVLGFSAWSRDENNALYDPVVAVLGPRPSAGFSPEEWGDADTVFGRLAPFYDDIDVQRREHRWAFESLPAAMHFLRTESPVHIATFERAGARRDELAAAFEASLRPLVDASGGVSVTAPYVVVSAVRLA